MGCSSSTNDEKPVVEQPNPGVVQPPIPLMEIKKYTAVVSPIPDDFDWKNRDKIGMGAFSKVYKCKHLKTGKDMAIKKITKSHLQKHDFESLKKEVSILSQVDYEHIIAFEEFYDEKKYFYVVTEILDGGELFDRVCEKVVYTEKDARQVVKVLLETLSYLHERKVAHRDVKPENLLLKSKDDDTSIKLADFGFATPCANRDLNQVCGTPDYVAPEIVKHEKYGCECDIWSAGIITYILLGGYPPFQTNTDNRDELFKAIKRGVFHFHTEYWSEISQDSKDFIKRMLVTDPLKRASAKELLQDKWMTMNDNGMSSANLTGTITKLNEFNAKRKLKAGVHTLIAACRIRNAINGLNSSEGSTGALTEGEEAEYREAFKNFDKDGDGSITIDELTAMVETICESDDANNNSRRHSVVKLNFQSIDKNGDGLIDFDEFCAMMGSNQNHDSKAELKSAFDIFDKDGDGQITLAEMSKIMSGLDESLSEENIAAMLAHADVNNDGIIDFDEFYNLMSSKS